VTFTTDKYAIAGLGVTDQGRLPGRTDLDFKVESLELAMQDAGISPQEIDGFMFQPGVADMTAFGRGGEVVKQLGMRPNFVWTVQSGGTSTISMISMAIGAIESGLATVVAVNYGDSALSQGALVGESGTGGSGADSGIYGMYSPGAEHALAAMRHMKVFGTTKKQLGAIPITARQYANLRPDAYLHAKPLTMEEYLKGRPLADPLNRYDYCLVADGGTSLIVTSTERAKDLKTKPVLVSGIGLSLSQDLVYARTQFEAIGIEQAKNRAFDAAKMTLADIDMAQIYDCFSITVLLALEGLGICPKGEGGPFVADGNLGPKGAMPTNTAGGELAWSYQQGFTPVAEAVRQLRGEGGPTQIDGAETCVVTGHGGVMGSKGQMDFAESCMILKAGGK
jgi:acetyl-CoA acetyltransferase